MFRARLDSTSVPLVPCQVSLTPGTSSFPGHDLTAPCSPVRVLSTPKRHKQAGKSGESRHGMRQPGRQAPTLHGSTAGDGAAVVLACTPLVDAAAVGAKVAMITGTVS